jgi:hypothetical protein
MSTNDGRIDHLQGGVAQSASSERFKDHIPNAAVGPLSRDNLDENGRRQSEFEAAAGSEVMIDLSREVRK